MIRMVSEGALVIALRRALEEAPGPKVRTGVILSGEKICDVIFGPDADRDEEQTEAATAWMAAWCYPVEQERA